MRCSEREPLIELAKDDPQRFRRQRARAGGQGLRDHLVLARGRPDLEALIVLDLADLRGDLGTAIEQSDQVLVEPVDLPPQVSQSRVPFRVGRFRRTTPIFRAAGWADCVGRACGSYVDSVRNGPEEPRRTSRAESLVPGEPLSQENAV